MPSKSLGRDVLVETFHTNLPCPLSFVFLFGGSPNHSYVSQKLRRSVVPLRVNLALFRGDVWVVSPILICRRNTRPLPHYGTPSVRCHVSVSPCLGNLVPTVHDLESCVRGVVGTGGTQTRVSVRVGARTKLGIAGAKHGTLRCTFFQCYSWRTLLCLPAVCLGSGSWTHGLEGRTDKYTP